MKIETIIGILVFILLVALGILGKSSKKAVRRKYCMFTVGIVGIALMFCVIFFLSKYFIDFESPQDAYRYVY